MFDLTEWEIFHVTIGGKGTAFSRSGCGKDPEIAGYFHGPEDCRVRRHQLWLRRLRRE